MGERLTDDFMNLFSEKNSDGTRNLRLKGKDMYQRIGKRLLSEDMIIVSSYLSKRPQIIKLDLSYNDIGDEGIKYLVEGYLSDYENSLIYLNIIGCSIGWKGVNHLCETAETLELKTLRLACNKLRGQGGEYAARLLSLSKIQHYDLGDTDQTLSSLMYILEAIRDSDASGRLKLLDLSRIVPSHQNYCYDPEHLAENIGIMLKVNSTLVELHLQKNQLDGHDIELLVLGLQYNKTLLLLDLGYNRIGDHGIKVLAKWLKTYPVLLGLNVAGNGIKDSGSRSLSFGLPFSRVRLLDLSFNNIGDPGLIDILNSVKKPYMLRFFYFWGNNPTPATLKIVRRMLETGVLVQDHIDVKLYIVDGIIKAAFYPSDHYKHRYYCVMDHGCPVELRIKRNKIEKVGAQPRSLADFHFYDRFPAVDVSLPPVVPTCNPPPGNV